MIAFVMDLYSSFPSEFLMRPADFCFSNKPFEVTPWLGLKMDMMLTYGSLPRPPELTTIYMSSSSISSAIDSGTLTIDNIVMEWRPLDDRYIPRAERFRLATVQQLIELAAGGYCYEFMLLSFKGLRVITPHIVGIFVALLILLNAPQTVTALLCVNLLLFMYITHEFQELPALITKTEVTSEQCSFLLALLDLSESFLSPQCDPSQGELCLASHKHNDVCGIVRRCSNLRDTTLHTEMFNLWCENFVFTLTTSCLKLSPNVCIKDLLIILIFEELDRILLMLCSDGDIKELRIVGLHSLLIGLLYESLVRPPELHSKYLDVQQ